MPHSSPHILLIDDEPDILELLSMTIDRMGLLSDTATSVKDAIAKLNGQSFDLCLTDLRLPDGSGLEIVAFIQQSMPQLPVAVISAHGNMQAAIDAMKTGAFDFVSKPIDLNQLRALIESALALDDSSNEKKYNGTGPNLLGQSPAIQHIREQIKRLARSMAPVHIHGESGTGKELVARLIHNCSPRNENPFIAVNSSAIPAELMESEFFGHRKGSFTGAVSDNPGLFQAAKGGTLFLDEIADLPLPMQAKLLRAIQERAIRPVGGHEEMAIDCRILSATHQDLKKLVDHGKFREDLYYRINVIDLDVPPLRSRIEDIAPLAEHILKQIAERNSIGTPEIEPGLIDVLSSYSFPGNIRELENILERAVALGAENEITANDLNLPVSSDSPAAGICGPAENESLEEFLQHIEKDLILKALEESGNNKTRAAESLG
ncbi:MAG: sigma-54 dependent transcriptional regulator, partial [Pseudomonadota bacterium]|nr:sigma-54 dependent transcriptional regulator [Pseudomonadota bacterium]